MQVTHRDSSVTFLMLKFVRFSEYAPACILPCPAVVEINTFVHSSLLKGLRVLITIHTAVCLRDFRENTACYANGP